MAFKRAQKPTFTTLVTVNIPNDKGGFDKNTFTGVFRRIETDEREALAALSHADLVRSVLVNWDMTDDDTKEKVPFSGDELEAALKIPPTPLATSMAFWESINGARTKN